MIACERVAELLNEGVEPGLAADAVELETTERVDSSAKAVSKFHTHSIPLDMEDIERDWDKPVLNQ